MYGARLLLIVVLLLLSGPVNAGAPQPILPERFVIVVDPGHGGSNSGCLAFDEEHREKTVTMALALVLREELEEVLPHAEVRMTRERDETVPLAERVALANAADADLFLSIHANASPHQDQRGFETYVLDLDTTAQASAWIASRENESGRMGQADPVLGMIRQLHHQADRHQAIRLAQSLQEAQSRYFPDRIDRGVKEAPFDVLMGLRMPGVLFEAGFLDHRAEGLVLMDSRSRRRIATALAEGLADYYREYARRR